MRYSEATNRWGYENHDGAKLPFVIGHNHLHRLWESCDASDIECNRENLFERVYQSNQTTAALDALDHLREWGFSGVGYDPMGGPGEDIAGATVMSAMPFYALTGPLDNASHGPSLWRPTSQITFPDPWDQVTVQAIRSKITNKCKAVHPYRHNLLGYIWTDLTAWDIKVAQETHSKDWVSTIRCLPAGAAGRTKYNDFLKQIYCNSSNVTRCDPVSVCTAYGLNNSLCRSWEQLDVCAVKNTKVPAAMDDDYNFLPQIAAEVFNVTHQSIQTCDPEVGRALNQYRATQPFPCLTNTGDYFWRHFSHLGDS